MTPFGGRALVLLAVALLSACRAASPASGASQRFRRTADAPAAPAFTRVPSERAEAHGAGPPLVISVEAAAPGDRVGGVVEVPGEECLLVIARSANTVDDLDLFLYADDGAVLAADESAEKEAAVLVCPPHPRHVYVAARVAAGHGVVAVVGHLVPPARAETVAKALEVRGGAGPGGGTEPWPSLDQVLSEHRRFLGGSWQTQRRVVVPTDPRVPTRLSARVDANACLDVLAVPSEDVSHLELSALDVDGQIIARAPSEGLERALVLCSPLEAVVTLELRPHAGRGVVALLLSRATDDASEAVGGTLRHDVMPTASLDDVRRLLKGRLEARGYEIPKALAQGELRVGSRQSTALELPGGCMRLDVLLGKPGLGVEAWLWDGEGSLLAHDGGGGDATLFACSSRGPGRMDVEAVSRPGPFIVEARSMPRAAKLLAETPLAASRLLAKLDAIGLLETPADAGFARRVRLTPEAIHREKVTVPIGRCVTVAAATDRGATGTEVRLLESTTQTELGRARGTHSASVRACALDVPDTLAVVAEIRVAAGSADGLVASRLTTPSQ